MVMEYTKGEWQVARQLTGEGYNIFTEDELICSGARHYNTHLIAAAPEMYEALKSWNKLREMQPLDSGADIAAILQECSAITDKAISKAEGK
jgi:hypothetical protein